MSTYKNGITADPDFDAYLILDRGSNGISESDFPEEERPSEQQIGGDHYKDMAIEPSEFIHRNDIGWLEGNAIKYICRHAQKHGEQDIEKAIHYLHLLLEWEYDHYVKGRR